MSIYQAYLGETLTIVEQKPYQLVYDVKGIGFNKADTLARNVGIQFNDPERLKAGVLYVLEEECIKQGHTYLPTQTVLDMTSDMLSNQPQEIINHEQLEEVMQQLVDADKLIRQDTEVAIPSLYYSELKSVQNLYRNFTYTNKLKEIEQSDLLLEIGEIETRNDVNYAESQREALQTAINSKVMLLTGGPGTGKTTVIKGIVELYAEIHGLSLDYDDYKMMIIQLY